MQFEVERRRGPDRNRMGSLSYAQLMREAYPGAVYYYATSPCRVYRVHRQTRVVEVRSEKRYTTQPQRLPTLAFPNVSSGSTHNGFRMGELRAVECDLQIWEALCGYKERRGPSEFSVSYPIPPGKAVYFDQPRFSRNYFTTGVVVAHPVLNEPSVRCEVLAGLIFEGFLMAVAFERQDLSSCSDKFRAEMAGFEEGSRFVCFYD